MLFVGYVIVVKITALRDILQGEDDEREELTRNYFDGPVPKTYVVSIIYHLSIQYVHTYQFTIGCVSSTTSPCR